MTPSSSPIDLLVDRLPWAFSHVALVLLVRSLPAALYIAASRRMSVSRRVLAAVLCAALFTALDHSNRQLLYFYAGGIGYYAVCAAILFWLTRKVDSIGGLDAIALFAVLALLFVALPILLLAPPVAAAFSFLGWELTLKGYSYCVEPASRRDDLKTVVFYFLVDPTLVYGQRGQQAYRPGGDRQALLRFGLGTFALLLPAALSAPSDVLTRDAEGQIVERILGGAFFYALLPFLANYSRHSGVASVQIALLRVAGYRVPERYRYPLLARSPTDFWDRWNTYVGAWLKRYIHLPVGLHFARLGRPSVRKVGPIASVAAVFLTIGLMHDGFSSLSSMNLSTRWTQFFVVNAVLIAGWLQLRDLVIARLLVPASRAHRFASRVAFGAAFLVAVNTWSWGMLTAS